MTIICMVAADFCGPDGQVFSVTAKDKGIIITAPEWIKDTLMFKLLASDGSLKFVTKANQKEAENDPLKGINAEGKKIKEEPEKAPAKRAAKKEKEDA